MHYHDNRHLYRRPPDRLVHPLGPRARLASWLAVLIAFFVPSLHAESLDYSIAGEVKCEGSYTAYRDPTTGMVSLSGYVMFKKWDGSTWVYSRGAVWVGFTWDSGSNNQSYPNQMGDRSFDFAQGTPPGEDVTAVLSVDVLNQWGYYQNVATVPINLDGAPNIRKVRISYFNDKEFPVKARLVDRADPTHILGEETIEPHTGFSKEFILPDEPVRVEAADLLILTDGYLFDGSAWVKVDGAVEEVKRVQLPTQLVDDVDTPAPETTQVDQPNELPDNPTTMEDAEKGVWKSGNGSTAPGQELDKATFREGINKLLSAQGGSSSSNVAAKVSDSNTHLFALNLKADQTNASLQGINNNLSLIKSALTATESPTDLPELDLEPHQAVSDSLESSMSAVLPEEPPVIQMPLQDGSISLHFGRINGSDYSWTIDMTSYASSIAIFRTLCNGVLLILFFVIYIKTIRGAFAS